MKTALFIMLFGWGATHQTTEKQNVNQEVRAKQEVVLQAELHLTSNQKWIKGQIYCLPQDDGQLLPVKYVFPGVANGKGEFAQNSQFQKVEKGSRVSIRKGFTHMITVPGQGMAYVKIP
jgi:hypothetical protein